MCSFGNDIIIFVQSFKNKTVFVLNNHCYLKILLNLTFKRYVNLIDFI